MLDIEQIRKEIDTLENGKTTHDAILKLNNLYFYLERHAGSEKQYIESMIRKEQSNYISSSKNRATSENISYWNAKEKQRSGQVTSEYCVKCLKRHLSETEAELSEMWSSCGCEEEMAEIRAFAERMKRFL